MDTNQKALNQIALTLTKHFDSLYYVDILTGKYIEYTSGKMLETAGIPHNGADFFNDTQRYATRCVHPDDLSLMIEFHDKTVMLERLSENRFNSIVYRLILNGRIIRVRNIVIMCEDNAHILCCLENIEDELQEREERERNLRSAQRMARLDVLTGIRNKTAFAEYGDSIKNKILSVPEQLHFAIVMCDMNDLKLINDTRGHSFGDEALMRTSRMICEIYDHSPVFRIGGDEFVVILEGRDYDERDFLLEKLREESLANKRSRSGPEIACGMAVFENGDTFDAVVQRADQEMYANKKDLKSSFVKDYFMDMEKIETPITAERKRLLDGMFGALYTMSGGGYVFLNDMRYDLSRWSLPLVDDFGMKSEYMYHADQLWQEHIHPEDKKVYREAVDAVLCGNAELRAIKYRARRADGTYAVCSTRGFVLSDKEGKPEYFGGIITTE